MSRTKKVVYQDLFNPTTTIEAPNKLLSFLPRWKYVIREFVKENTKCMCRHPRFEAGVCHYRTCRHKEDEHFIVYNVPTAWKCTNCAAEMQIPESKIKERIECVCGADEWKPLEGKF